ncbi:MAG: hypothetical protein IID43_06580 [Planctomycetes bacterium]|nr:hypothetical protein [Planctomycetota bacterium]
MTKRLAGVESSFRRLGPRMPAAVLAGVLLTGLPCIIWSCATPVGVVGDLGITTGGQQDIASARRTIEGGGVPDPASITVEGFLSEHSIPVEEPEDAGLLYATTSVAWNKDFDAFTPLATIQIGFGTTIDPETSTRNWKRTV